MQISRTIAYAVQATTALATAKPDRPISCSTLAKRGEMPERFLLQILHSLVTHGILNSVPGASGGYYLARPPNEISLLDIVEACDFPMEPSVPDLQGLPARLRRELMATVGKIAASARRELQLVTIADLAHCAGEPEQHIQREIS